MRVGSMGMLGLLLAGCRVEVLGFPVDTGEWVVEPPVWEGDEVPPGCTQEVEPNDLEADDGSDVDWVGIIHPDRFARYCGSIGPRGSDVDVAFFELLARGEVTAQAVPLTSGTVDLLVIDANADKPVAVAGGDPWSGVLRVGFHGIAVFSSQGDTPDYRLDIKVE